MDSRLVISFTELPVVASFARTQEPIKVGEVDCFTETKSVGALASVAVALVQRLVFFKLDHACAVMAVVDL